MHEKMKTILIVDDDVQLRAALKEAVARIGYSVLLAEDPVDAIKKLDDNPVSMIVTDMKMPRMDGVAFIKEARKRVGSVPILVITGFATIENAVNAMKEGACDYLMKPFSFDELTKAIESVMSTASQARDEVLTNSQHMKNLLQLSHNVSLSDMTVLILGESGTGKELFARYIHKTSRRNKKQFIAVNCAAIPENLLESELFGYEKGAFTGALEKKTGKFELAHGGTILLDEIGEMSAILQAKLLRVLQEREIDRIGGKQPVPVDVRVIATTNRDLNKEMQEGKFREDLYYRLSAFPIQLPPLRERTEDIMLLSEHFASKYGLQLNKSIAGFTKDAEELLTTRQWKGNIRELENAIQRAVIIAKSDIINAGDFMLENPSDQSCPGNGSIRVMEMDLIRKTLEETNGNKTKAAKMLGVSVRTIRNKLHEYGKNFPAV
jgi:DNA-binding NtrC family response regulator